MVNKIIAVAMGIVLSAYITELLHLNTQNKNGAF
jgi:hypothetical protein